MANINLSNQISNFTDEKSSVDSKIVLNRKAASEIIYSDVKFDLEFENYNNPQLNSNKTSTDIKQIVNEESILVSLRNCLNLFKGSRLLNPELEFDIRSYLFEPLDEHKAYIVGYNIFTSLPALEPRVKINNVSIGVNYFDDCYELSISIGIPSLSKDISLKGILNQDGFYIR